MRDVPNRSEVREISTDGCEVVGKGFTSTIYALDERRVAKVYKPRTPLDKVRQEFELTRAVNASGVPSVEAYELVRAMPQGTTYVHGDLHPGNIMLRGDELVLIDLPGLSEGTPLCDMAITYRGMVMGPKSLGIKKREENMGMPAAMIAEVGDRFFMGYAELGTRAELDELYEWLHPLYALSVVVMCGNGRLRDDKLAGFVMDGLLRKVVVPQQDVVRQVWATGWRGR